MIQYLVNSTAIWLISLLVFDVSLRRESYHTYNRFYLLATFLLGLLLPLVQWQSYEYLQAGLQQPVQQVIVVKDAIERNAAVQQTFDWERWTGFAYMQGVIVALILLALDIVKLTRYYAMGVKTKYGSWTVVTTARNHAPFSFRKLLFVNTREQYSEEEWNMLFIHEQQHTRRLHVLDLMLMQLARVVFWFHPLVYIYNKRLLMVHEYQADSVPSVKPQEYGHFLVEQALLQSAPAITHSFNRSPIKKRIMMLTRRSTNASRTKMLVFLPIAMVSIFCFSQNGFSQKFDRKGNVVTYRGNKFVFSEQRTDTIELMDPVTGAKTTSVMVIDAEPQSMNGKPIPVRDNQMAPPAYEGKYKNLRWYMLAKMQAELAKLPDGIYKLDVTNIVIDEQGRIVYFDYREMLRDRTVDTRKPDMIGQPRPAVVRDPGVKVSVAGLGDQQFSMRLVERDSEPIDKDSQQKIFDLTSKIMNDARVYRPAMKDGAPVVSVIKLMEFFNRFKVENHKLYDRDKDGKWVEVK